MNAIISLEKDLTARYEYAKQESAPESCLGNAVGSATILQPKTSKRGGPRPGFGGPQPGSGRPRKLIIAPIRPAYVPNTPVWCVIAFWGQAEISGTRELTREGYETYLPMVAIRRRDPVILTAWHTVRVPYLPGYGFIRITQTQSREPIQATRGVRDVLRRPDGKAAWVRDGEIERMMSADAERLELPNEVGTELVVGSKVQIESGPFMSHRGVVMECDGVKTRVEVNMFGRMTPVWLDRVSVEPV